MSRTPSQWMAALVGAVFLLVGILGFVPGVTSNVDQINFFGPESNTQLLHLFEVSIFHNLFHLAFGVAGILASRTWMAARGFLIGGGVIYLVLWIYGLSIDLDSAWNFIPVDTADNWLHFGLGLAMVAMGLLASAAAGKRTTTTTTRERA